MGMGRGIYAEKRSGGGAPAEGEAASPPPRVPAPPGAPPSGRTRPLRWRRRPAPRDPPNAARPRRRRARRRARARPRSRAPPARPSPRPPEPSAPTARPVGRAPRPNRRLRAHPQRPPEARARRAGPGRPPVLTPRLRQVASQPLGRRFSQRAAPGASNGDDAVATTETVVDGGRRRVGHPARAIDHKGVLMLAWREGEGRGPDTSPARRGQRRRLPVPLVERPGDRHPAPTPPLE